MKTSTHLAAFVAVLLVVPTRADAQHLQLKIENGLVTLDAQNVSVRQILAEWARVGGARIINGEKVMGAPVTLQLNGVPERNAIDTVLRGVSGYMLASRQDVASGASRFDRILIMPTSNAPRNTAAVGNPVFPVRQAPVQPAPEPVETEAVADDDRDEGEEGDAEVAEEETEQPVVQVQPGINPRFQRPPNFPTPNPMAPTQPFGPQGIPGPGAPRPVDGDDEAPPPQPSTNPFNVPAGASTTPGVISPVPQQEPQPGTRPRRPPL